MFLPFVVYRHPLFDELRQVAMHTFCKKLQHHFGGFLKNQRRLLSAQVGKEIKLILYKARIICTSVRLARNLEIDFNLISANQKTQIFDQDKLQELVHLKRAGENSFLDSQLKAHWMQEIQQKIGLIEESFEKKLITTF